MSLIRVRGRCPAGEGDHAGSPRPRIVVDTALGRVDLRRCGRARYVGGDYP